MSMRFLPAMAAAVVLAGALPAGAVDNASGPGDGGCICSCNLGDGWMSVGDLLYDTPAGGCSQLSNRTCNVEDPTQYNAVRTGRLYNCQPRITIEQTITPGGINGSLADPGRVDGTWTQQLESMPGGTLHQP